MLVKGLPLRLPSPKRCAFSNSHNGNTRLALVQFQFSMACLQRKPLPLFLATCTSRHTHQILCICVVTCAFVWLHAHVHPLSVAKKNSFCFSNSVSSKLRAVVILGTSQGYCPPTCFGMGDCHWSKVRLDLYSFFNVWLNLRLIGTQRALPGHPTCTQCAV